MRRILLFVSVTLITINVWGQSLNVPNGTIGLTTNPTTGNVGIGTTSPRRDLHVYSQSTPSAYHAGQFNIGGSTGVTNDIVFSQGIDYTAKTSFLQSWRSGYGTASILLNPLGGNVGIGTITPDTKLDVTASGANGIVLNQDLSALGNSARLFFKGDTETFTVFNNQGELQFRSDALVGGSSGTVRMVLDGNGNLGVGTTSPNYTLDIDKGDSQTVNARLKGNAPSITYTVNREANSSAAAINAMNLSFDNGTEEVNLINVGMFAHTNLGSTPTLDYLFIGKAWNDNAFRIYPDKKAYFDGKVGVGTTNPGSYELAVEGKIGAHEVVVTTDGWADFVFEPEYDLISLSDLDNYIQENKHLPEIPTTAEVEENGISVGEMNAKLLQKIEELTLYVIELKKENETQGELIKQLLNKTK